MSIRVLRTFLAIADAGSFSAAAETVLLTQGAVSAQMKALEQDLGVELFDRSRRPPVLNAVGRVLVPKAREVVRGYEQLRAIAQDSAHVEGTLRIGSVPSALTGLLPRALSRLRFRHPRLHVAVVTGLSAELVGSVMRGALDAAVVSDFVEPRPTVAWEVLARELLVLIAPPDAPDVTAEELLAHYPYIEYSPSAWAGQLIDRTLKARDLTPRTQMVMDSLEAVRAMVGHGLGVSIVPQRRVGEPADPPVRRLLLRPPAVFRTLGLVHPTDHAGLRLIRLLSAEIRQIVEHGDAPNGTASTSPRHQSI